MPDALKKKYSPVFYLINDIKKNIYIYNIKNEIAV